MNTEQTQVVGVPDADRTQVAAPFNVEQTQAAIRIECPVCRTSNAPGERFCQDCGFLLSGTPGETSAEEPPAETLPRLVAAGGREFLLRAGANSVGRENADILLQDVSVSRQHATITLEDGGAVVEDHGSTNGTRVAGETLAPREPRPLYDGDEVRFGSAIFTIALPGAPPRPAEEPSPSTPAAPQDGTIRARLVAPDGTDLSLRDGVNSIGRRSENDVVVLGDPYVSGRHAEIDCTDEGCFLTDVGSTNGTFLRDERLAPGDRHTLVTGDEVRLGQSVFTFETVAPPEPTISDFGFRISDVSEEPDAQSDPGGTAEEPGTTAPPKSEIRNPKSEMPAEPEAGAGDGEASEDEA